MSKEKKLTNPSLAPQNLLGSEKQRAWETTELRKVLAWCHTPTGTRARACSNHITALTACRTASVKKTHNHSLLMALYNTVSEPGAHLSMMWFQLFFVWNSSNQFNYYSSLSPQQNRQNQIGLKFSEANEKFEAQQLIQLNGIWGLVSNQFNYHFTLSPQQNQQN